MRQTIDSNKITYNSLQIPLLPEEREYLALIKKQGMSKGHWVAEAIREKMAREKNTRLRLFPGVAEEEG